MMTKTTPMTRTSRKLSRSILALVFWGHVGGVTSGVALSFSPPAFEPTSWRGSFWDAERADWEGKPHEAARLRDRFLQHCRPADADPEIAFACRLLEGERRERSPWLHLPFARFFLSETALPWSDLAGLPIDKRSTWEARTFLSP